MMSEQENNNKGFIPLKFTPLTFQTPTGNQLFSSSTSNLQSSGRSGNQQSDAIQPPGTPRPMNQASTTRPMNPPSTPSQLSKPVRVVSSSGSSKTQSGPACNFPPSSPRVLFPRPASASSTLFTGSNDQKIPKLKTKSGTIRPPLQQVQQNNVEMEAEEKAQVDAQLQGVLEQIQLLKNSNIYEQLVESFQQTVKSLENFGKNQSALISLVQEFKRISDEMLAGHQQRMEEKEVQIDVLQGREEQALAQLRSLTDERDGIQHKLNEIKQSIRKKNESFQEMERIILEQRNDYENLTKSYNQMQNERDKAVLELAEEKSGTQALLKEFKKLRDRVFNETSSSNLVSEKQEKRPRVDTSVATNASLPPTPRTANVAKQEVALSSVNRAVSTGTNSRKIKRGASKDRKTPN